MEDIMLKGHSQNNSNEIKDIMLKGHWNAPKHLDRFKCESKMKTMKE
jgi:hypothetical protein